MHPTIYAPALAPNPTLLARNHEPCLARAATAVTLHLDRVASDHSSSLSSIILLYGRACEVVFSCVGNHIRC